MIPRDVLLELRNITKTYHGLAANDAVSLALEGGQILALLGENGAGKSTLMKVLFGLVKPDSGEILRSGQPVSIHSPQDAHTQGLGMVQQHFALFDGMNVLENIAVGLPGRSVDQGLRAEVEELSSTYGLGIDPDALVFKLSAGEKQRIEIIRTMLGRPEILILDEPTSVLTPPEATQLFAALRRLRDDGKSIIFITHKLAEVQELCDAAIVLRRGKVVGSCDPRQTSRAEMAAMMLGQELEGRERSHTTSFGDERLRVLNIAQQVEETYCQISDLTVRSGEILGVAGVAGNGQEALYQVLSGEVLTAPESLVLDGQAIGALPPNHRRRLGGAFVPEERLGHAAVPHLSLHDNTLLSSLTNPNFQRMGLIFRGNIAKESERIAQDYDVRHNGLGKAAKSLSGGNLQKFVVGRELEKSPQFIVINQPTWGVDLGAAARIRDELSQLARQGAAVVVISQDLDELLELSDSLAVLNQGTLSAAKPTGDWDLESLGEAMLGEHATPTQEQVAA